MSHMKWRLLVWQLLGFPALLVAQAPVSAQAPALESAVTFEYPPFIMEDKVTGQLSGYGIEVYRALTAGTPLNGPIIVEPLARAKAELGKGMYLIGLGSRNHHAEAVASGKLIPVQVGSIQFHFFHLKNNFSNPQLNSFEQYRKHTVCGQNESAAAPVFGKLKIKYDMANDLPTVFRKVAAGRCHFGFSSDLAFAKFIQIDPMGEQFMIDKFVILDVTVDILVSSNYPNAKKIVQDLTLSLDHLRKDGSLLRMAEKSFGAGAVPEYFLNF